MIPAEVAAAIESRSPLPYDEWWPLVEEGRALAAKVARMEEALREIVGTDGLGFYDGAEEALGGISEKQVLVNHQDFYRLLRLGRAALKGEHEHGAARARESAAREREEGGHSMKRSRHILLRSVLVSTPDGVSVPEMEWCKVTIEWPDEVEIESGRSGHRLRGAWSVASAEAKPPKEDA